MNILSLFDGISCGQLALQRAGIEVNNYYASEIDKYAIQVTQKNFPNTIQLGDVSKIIFFEYKDKIDLLIGGSPCQDLSVAKQDREGLKGSKSSLFYKYLDALKIIKPKFFLLENVASMKNEDRDTITKELNINPIMINSALISALERKRYYWTNIPNILQPKNKNLFCIDIIQLENEVDERFYFSEKTEASMQKIIERSKARKLGFRSGLIINLKNEKFKNLDANYHKGCDGKRSMFEINNRHRMATPIEAERLQTLPDNYTEGISNTQRYKCIGNGWTVDVISHIFKNLKSET